MNVGHVKGAGGIEPTPNRGDKAVKGDNAELGRSGERSDEAQISSASRDTLKAVEALSQRAQGQEDRVEKVDAARARLESGALDRPEVYEQTAKALLEDNRAPTDF